MKARSFKKFFVSIALSAVLTLSSASSVFAATAQLVPAEPSVELAQSDDSDIPAIESSDAQNACASLTAQSGIRQQGSQEFLYGACGNLLYQVLHECNLIYLYLPQD